ncbi:hypothetical protein IB232_13700 [Pseudomonas sp. PDM15]|uniref:hypothetical protein n=1 Tax=Pseudomonas sp. PDM15 TaxID=2769303 RepID=UPI00177E95F3|nr:hypothetical protein [Pseudomonas sp. PDM15]MBD9426385.1 hypothetical protein [Pseudomonas sp. PDM15]
MITFMLLWGALAAVLVGWANQRGHYLLGRESRGLQARLGDPVRSLLSAERQALTQRFHLAFHSDLAVYRLTCKVGVVGWREPLFLLQPYHLDGRLLVGLPESLYSCAEPLLENQVELVLNPHQGAPHAFVVSLNGASLLCDCEARAAGILLSPPSARQRVESRPDCQFHAIGGDAK